MSREGLPRPRLSDRCIKVIAAPKCKGWTILPQKRAVVFYTGPVSWSAPGKTGDHPADPVLICWILVTIRIRHPGLKSQWAAFWGRMDFRC
jgi:hypothetical protein